MGNTNSTQTSEARYTKKRTTSGLNNLLGIRNNSRYNTTQNGNHSIGLKLKKNKSKSVIKTIEKEKANETKEEEKYAENKIFKYVFSPLKKIQEKKSFDSTDKLNLADSEKKRSMVENEIPKNFK